MADIAATLRATLERQHERIKGQLQLVQETKGEARAAAFLELRRLLAAHEAVEQSTMHPTVREATSAADVVKDRVDEEGKATAAIEELEQFDVDSDDFSERFAQLAHDVVSHAEAEEHVELPVYLSRADERETARVVHALSGVDALAGRIGTGGIAGPAGFAAMLQQAKADVASASGSGDPMP